MTELNCDRLLAKLDDLVDGRLEEAEEVAARAHLERCPECRSELDRLQRLVSAARSLPRSIQPERDLWPGIEAEVRSQRVVRGGFGRPAARRLWLAAAAAAVLAVSMTLAYLAGMERARPRSAQAPPVSEVTDVTEAAYDGLSTDLRRARDQLRSSLDRRRDELSPETWSVVMDNLQLIDNAIGRIGAALAENPNDGQLNRQLALAYRRQIDLLQLATRLPAEV